MSLVDHIHQTMCVCFYLCAIIVANINNFNFHPFEVLSRYSDPQIQVGENYSYLFNLGPDICKS